MASLFAHAALPVVASAAFPGAPSYARRLAWTAAIVGCVADLDMASLLFEVRPPSALGHGGLMHSFVAAFAFAVVAALLAFRALGVGSRAWWRVTAFLFACAASHPLLDAMTAGDVGVALFWPITSEHFVAPFKLIPSCPLGLKEYLGFWGILTFANELLYVVAPAMVVVALVKARKRSPSSEGPSVARIARGGVLLAVMLVGARLTFPEYFEPMHTRVVMPTGSTEQGDMAKIPHDDLPDGKLLTKLDELRAANLLNRDLAPKTPPWSSSFFPSWLGGEGGRWSDGTPRLVWRDLFGFAPPTDADARARTVNGAFRYWSGRCNGVASAALAFPEPFRTVEVIGVDGARTRFHPNDVKSLLAVAYNATHGEVVVGGVCTKLGFDVGATCSMSPAVLVVAVANRLGLAGTSFLIDALPTPAKQYYAVAGARIDQNGPPHPVGKTPVGPSLAPRIASLVDVTLTLTLSSTVLPYAPANRIDSHFADGTGYERVGVQPVVMRYEAEVALDAASELIGGRWTGAEPDGPDDAVFVGAEPELVEGKLTDPDQLVPYSVIRELARASVDEGAAEPTIDLRTQCDGRCAFAR